MRRVRIATALVLAVVATAACPPTGAATSSAQRPPIGARRVLLAFLATPSLPPALGLLGGVGRIGALGLLDPTQGNYNQQQALLDLTQGARVSGPDYRPTAPPPLGLNATGRVAAWPAVLARAAAGAAALEPGLLAGSVPGGAAYAGVGRRAPEEAVVAADRTGQVARVWLGAARTLTWRVGALVRRYRLVVAVVPDLAHLDLLLTRRTPDELVLVLERPPRTAPGRERAPELLALGASGLPGEGATLRSPTTRRPGLVTGIDVAPTVLGWIGVPAPAALRGQALSATGGRDLAGLERLSRRLGVIAGRRWPAIGAFLVAWLALVLAGTGARGRPGARAGLRLGGLAALWTPCTVLGAAALAPSRAVEIAVVVGGGFLLAVISDRLLAWPRGPVAPAAAMVVLYAVDLWSGSPLISTSLLGSNPLLGSRFFGVGNEMEAALPIVLFAGLAAALPQRPARTRETVIFAGTGLAFTALVASGRLGADVGAVFTIGGGAAAGALVLRGRPRRGAVLLACAVPVLGLAALAGLDLLTAAGGHFTGTVLHASSARDVADTIGRKLAAALRELERGVMPVNTAVCLAAGAYAVRRRDRLLAPVGDAAGWRACLAGGFAGGVLGSLTNDSGPLLLVIATFGLACVTAYLRGGPAHPSYPPLRPS